MTKFISVTKSDTSAKIIYVNTQQIVSIEDASDGSALLMSAGKERLHVRERVQEVLSRCQTAK